MHVPAVAAVTGKVFVAAIAGKRHSHPLLRQLAHPVGGDGGAVGVGFVVECRQLVQQAEVLAAHGLLEVIGVVALRHHGGVFGFVELLDVKADGAGVHRFALQLGHHRHHRAGIHPAGEEGAQGHLRHQPHLHRLAQARQQFRLQVRLAGHRHRGEGNLPVLLLCRHRLAVLEQQGVAGAQLVHVAVDSFRFRHIAQGEVVLHRPGFQLPRQLRMRLEYLQLRAENQLAVGQHAVEQGLDAKAVTGQEQAAGGAVVEAKGKHAAEALHAGRAPGLPGVEDHLGVAVGAEFVAQAPQFYHQLAEIVDLAVVADAEIAVGAEHGLLAAGQVDDGQAPVGQAQARLRVQAAFVRTAMELGLVHGGEQFAIRLALPGEIKNAGDATHA